ncbi:TlpA family protein disulfide reductase [Marivirga arenosa]|uniref:Redoxin domain-containing protein n=1 Tax=Marivirga arenosa TaxID=3059076 RepID=A0AA49GDT7_9BACT|nr:redoxin domain-containing protein [Marivirga sp. BKB1-2]WKK79252.1 redoxin domain-containing protein [Marivirga sp. BKB1-2]
MRITIAIIFILSILTTIGFIFWNQEWKFSKPTPKPENLIEIESGDSVSASVLKALGVQNEEDVFVHFYNYDCPCSRFNIKEFKDLTIQYSDKVKFIAVLESIDKSPKEIKEFREKYDLGIRLHLDTSGEIANQLGIYSTPQAVLIKNNVIYFSGNYNKARFCTTQNTKFASIALQAMTTGKEAPVFPELATIAYGCELPANGNDLTRIDKFFNFLEK